MSTIKTDKFTIRWKKFWGRFIFWSLCIPVNIIPIFLKHYRNINPDSFPTAKALRSALAAMTVGDLDFSFISLSVVFVLCIEGFFAEEELSKIYFKFQLGAILYFFALYFLYTNFFFRPEMFSLLGHNGTITYNLILMGLTVILGILCNVTISMERSAK